MLSITEENYLKAIFKSSEPRTETVSTNVIAQEVQTSAASVTDMLKKLSAKGLIEYQKYKGVKLSNQGSVIATSLVRRHRLWETFLVDKLEFSWEEVHEMAEELEHIQYPQLIEKLDAFLGYPRYDPHGDPIPNAEGKFTLRDQQLLSSLRVSDESIVVGVKRHDADFLSYLNDLNINIGTKLSITEKVAFDKSQKALINQEKATTLSETVCRNIYVKKITP